MNQLCPECETVSHCLRNGCVPVVPLDDARDPLVQHVQNPRPIAEIKADIAAVRERVAAAPGVREVSDLHRLVDKALLAARRDQRDLSPESMAVAAEARTALLTALGVMGAPAPADKPPEDSYPDQTILHAEGECGNCLQATIAGVLGWPLAAVPHFALLGEDHWWDCAQAWLSSQGYWIDYKSTSYADQGGELLPRCWLSGRSPRGFSHAVIGDAATGQMLHDPHPSRAGLVKVDYTIYFFRKPARGVQACDHIWTSCNSGIMVCDLCGAQKMPGEAR